MSWVLAIFCSASVFAACSCAFPFRNVSLSWDVRVQDLMSRLTLHEMVTQMVSGGGYRKPSSGIERLGINPYNFDTECLHGILGQPTTAFPQSVGLSATFSPEQISKVAEAISIEARAIFNHASAHGDYGNMKSISCLAPFINIVHHPLWGRIQEVYGEDPYLSGQLAASYVKGLQGDHPRYVRANSGCKVVDVHSGPENRPVSRFSFNAVVSERDMRLTYLANFKTCIEAGTYNLMCSYNSINGVPACANKWLLQQVLREEYGFKGYYISDESAIENIYTQHHYVKSKLEAAAAAANAGVNLELPPADPVYLLLEEAVAKGMVTNATIAQLVKPLFYMRMKLGEFDPVEMNPYNKINQSAIESPEHRELAIETTAKTFVLLKNDKALLPLKKPIRKMAMVGPLCNDLKSLYGDYSPRPVVKFAKTPYQGLRNSASEVSQVSGCLGIACTSYNRTDLKTVILGADVIIACLGTGNFEGEGRDRKSLELPGKQDQMLMDLVAYAKGVPVILLVFSAGAVDLSWPKGVSGVGAIVQCFYPGQGTGEALRRVLTGVAGKVTSPAGRLPITYPASLDQVPPMTNYSMEGRTYRYSTGVPLYPFGYGLSYSNFHYTDLLAPPTMPADQDLPVQVTVTNKGPYDAEEVTQVYISWAHCPEPMPRLQMVGVKRQMLLAGSSTSTTFLISSEQLKIWDDHVGFIYFQGQVDVYVGGQQPNQKTSVGSNVLHMQVNVTMPTLSQ